MTKSTAKMARKLHRTPEPRWRLGPPEWKLTDRTPIIVVCSWLHQTLRDNGLRGSGIDAGWPQWDEVEARWTITFSIGGYLSEREGPAVARFFIWPDGLGFLHLYDKDGEMITKFEVQASAEDREHEKKTAGKDSTAIDNKDDNYWNFCAVLTLLLKTSGDQLVAHLKGFKQTW